MTLTDKFTDKIVKKFRTLSIKKQFKPKNKKCMGLDIEDFVYENYAYVLILANMIGIRKGEAIVFCQECEDECQVFRSINLT